MKSEELIRNNALTNIEVKGGQQVVFIEIALTAANMAKCESLTEAEGLVIEERKRQIIVEKFNINDDNCYESGELAIAAACYAIPENNRCLCNFYDGQISKELPTLWPENWGANWWKPTPNNRIRELVKAGALILAEIERLQRLDLKNKTDE